MKHLSTKKKHSRFGCHGFFSYICNDIHKKIIIMTVTTKNGPKIRSTEKNEEFKLKNIEFFKDVRNKFDSILDKNKVSYFNIGSLVGSNYYKYMDLETALICLETKSLRFAEPSLWQDNYESRFYNANYNTILAGRKETEVCPLIYSTCLTGKKNNEAAWKIYTYGKVGLGARCVEFTLSKSELRKELISSLKDFSIYEGLVSYVWEGDVDRMHQKTIRKNKKIENNLWYQFFFTHFGMTEYLNLMLLKRDAFEHEQETRIMLVPNNPTIEKGKKHVKNGKTIYGSHKDVTIDWGKIIKEVRYSDSCTDVEIKLLKDAVRKAVGFVGDDATWEKDKRCPQCYYIYGKRKRIMIK